MVQLTATEIKNLTTPGRYVDGDGLILNVASGSSKGSVLRVRVVAAQVHAERKACWKNGKHQAARTLIGWPRRSTGRKIAFGDPGPKAPCRL